MAFRTSFARAALCVINLFVLLGGVAILAVGAWIVSDLKNIDDTEIPGASMVCIIGVIAITIGAVISVIGVSGVYGACRESVCCLKLYIILLSLIVILELVLGTMSIVLSGKIESRLEEQLLKYVMVYNHNGNVTAKIDRFQYGLQCCGSLGPGDYELNTNISASIYDVPASCCKPEVVCVMDEFESETIYQTGCAEKMVEYAESYLGVVAGVSFAVLVCEIIALVFACFLIRSIQDEPKV